MELKLFVPLAKVDAVKREVWGVLAAEVPDTSGEIFDYELSKPYFQKWNERFEKVTDGKSLGNLRAMHGAVAAGKFIDFVYDDANKMVHVGSKVVDDAEWQKVLEGVYTGFSIGGKYVRKWKDGELTRYVANPSEGSLVDSPCIPVALFQMVKDGGAVEFRKFTRSQDKGVKLMDHTELFKSVASDLKKLSAQKVSEFYETLKELSEDPGTPKQWKKPVANLLSVVGATTHEEMDGMTDGDESQQIDDDAASAADPDEDAPKADMAMADKIKGLEKMQGEILAELKKSNGLNAAMAKRVEQLEKQPAAAKGSVRVISKEEDGKVPVEKKEEQLDMSKASTTDLIKRSLRQPLAS